MSKLSLAALAAVAALLTPALANAASATKVHGVVVAKERSRHVLVVASPRGAVTSARVPARRFRTIRVGTRVAVSGKKLADGSIRSTRLRKLGRARRAHLKVTVVKAGARKVLVAGGGSAFAIRLTHATRVLSGVHDTLKPGEQVETEVELGQSGAVGDTVHTLGQAVVVDFSGTITQLDSTSLTVANDGVTTVVQIPDGVVLPSLVQVGSEVEVVASVSGSTLTLVSVKLDGTNGSGDNGGSDASGSNVQVEGFVTALDATSITVQPGDSASPVTFTIPTGFTLPSGLQVGSKVEADGSVANAVLTLTKLDLQSPDGGQQELEAEGTVTALDASSITVQPAESGTPLTFAIPSGFTLPSGLAVGSIVDAKGETVGGVLTLTKLELQQSENDGQVEADGTVTALDSGSISIQTGDSSTPVTFSIPSGFTMPSGIQVGSVVKAQGQYANGVLTLTQIEINSDSGDGGSGGGSGSGGGDSGSGGSGSGGSGGGDG